MELPHALNAIRSLLKDLHEVPLPLKNSLGLLGALGPAGQPLQLQSSRPRQQGS